MGTGKYLDSPQKTNGASWKYSAYSGSTQWTGSGYATNVTASFPGPTGSAGGGVWYTVSGSSQTFAYTQKTVDIEIEC